MGVQTKWGLASARELRNPVQVDFCARARMLPLITSLDRSEKVSRRSDDKGKIEKRDKSLIQLRTSDARLALDGRRLDATRAHAWLRHNRKLQLEHREVSMKSNCQSGTRA